MLLKYSNQLLELSLTCDQKERWRSNLSKNLQAWRDNFFLRILKSLFLRSIRDYCVKKSCDILWTKRTFRVQCLEKLESCFSDWQTVVYFVLERSEVDLNNQILSYFCLLISEILNLSKYFDNRIVVCVNDGCEPFESILLDIRITRLLKIDHLASKLGVCLTSWCFLSLAAILHWLSNGSSLLLIVLFEVLSDTRQNFIRVSWEESTKGLCNNRSNLLFLVYWLAH